MPGAELPGVNLAKADLPRANFHRANLLGANLSGATAIGADLSAIELGGANLSKSTLTDANLARGNLTVANLSGANLAHADLRQARLLEANLVGANLAGADLSGADLSGADLSGANLIHARMDGTNLSLALFSQTILGAVDLGGTKGLDTCRHLRASFIDQETLMCSGPLPLCFLRGCGLPDDLIAYWAARPQSAGGRFTCRIEYAIEDRLFAGLLHSDLQGRGIRCWLAPQRAPDAGKSRAALGQPVRVKENTILVVSGSSVRSAWIAKHARHRREQKEHGQIFPLGIDGAGWTEEQPASASGPELGPVHDFRCWQDPESYRRALEQLITKLEGQSDPPQRRQPSSPEPSDTLIRLPALRPQAPVSPALSAV